MPDAKVQQSLTLKEPTVFKDSDSVDQPSVYPEPEVLEYMEHQSRLFEEKRKDLLTQYAGMFILFEDGQVIDTDQNEAALVIRAYCRTGPRHLFVKKVLAQDPQLTVRIPSIPS